MTLTRRCLRPGGRVRSGRLQRGNQPGQDSRRGAIADHLHQDVVPQWDGDTKPHAGGRLDAGTSAGAERDPQRAPRCAGPQRRWRGGPHRLTVASPPRRIVPRSWFEVSAGQRRTALRRPSPGRRIVRDSPVSRCGPPRVAGRERAPRWPAARAAAAAPTMTTTACVPAPSPGARPAPAATCSSPPPTAWTRRALRQPRPSGSTAARHGLPGGDLRAGNQAFTRALRAYVGVTVGGTFWLSAKTLSGSYLSFNATSG